ncbi:MAG: peptidoglycan-associated lipoprotein Pal [Pseudomonadota bacterium]|nr:peptidoglycan-associated lipoprotein Pal [Pseudomonadota bacterium]
MKLSHRHLLTLLAAASLAACSSVKLDDQAPVESRTGASAGSGAGGAKGANSSQTSVASVDASKGGTTAGMSSLPRVVYFDYDSYVVRADDRPVIEANARQLQRDPKERISVQGHTDDRGSSEYNLALGQRRAEAVVKSLELLGAQPTQLEAVSFGKERPAVQGENEEAWAKNRRAELASK